MFDLVITDADDTLYSWTSAFTTAMDSVIRICGLTDPEPFIRQIRHLNRSIFHEIELPRASIYQAATALGLPHPQQLARHFRQVYHQVIQDSAAAAREKLRELQDRQIPVVILTESPLDTAMEKLRAAGIDTVCEIWASGTKNVDLDHVHVRNFKKPDLDVLQQILDTHPGCRNVLYIGDSLAKDILPAKQLGLKTVQIIPEKPKNIATLLQFSHWNDDDLKANIHWQKTCDQNEIRPDRIISSWSKL